MKIVQPGTAGVSADAGSAKGPVLWIKLRMDRLNANAVEIGILDGQLYAKQFVDNTAITMNPIPYVAAGMSWVRLREANGTTYWEYAASSSGPWMVLHSEPNPVELSSVDVEIGAGAWPGAVGTVIFDSVNVP